MSIVYRVLTRRRTAGWWKLAVARTLTSPLIAHALTGMHRHRITNHGLCFDTRGSAFTPQTEALLYLGLYEKAEVRSIRAHLTGEPVVVELGSSLGVTAAHILDVMDPDGFLVCIEANPALVPTLRATIDAHRRNQRVEILQVAVYDEPVRIEVARWSTGSRITDNENGLEVPSMTLAEVLDRCGVDGPYALVTDIEGGEASFILGDTSGLDRCTLICAELDDCRYRGVEVSADHLFDRLRDIGYRDVFQHGPVVAMRR